MAVWLIMEGDPVGPVNVRLPHTICSLELMRLKSRVSRIVTNPLDRLYDSAGQLRWFLLQLSLE